MKDLKFRGCKRRIREKTVTYRAEVIHEGGNRAVITFSKNHMDRKFRPQSVELNGQHLGGKLSPVLKAFGLEMLTLEFMNKIAKLIDRAIIRKKQNEKIPV